MDSHRTVALWCPDWPTVAAAAEIDISSSKPVAVIAANRVVTCSQSARAVGVRRGMRKREAQAKCVDLHLSTADAGRDGRHFEPIVAAVADVIPVVEVIRPGLMVMSASGASRYFGSEEIAAEKLVDVTSACGVESFIGIADELFTAIVAARHSVIVPRGGDAQFLAPLHISEIGSEKILCAADRSELIDVLWRLGVRTLGAFAALSPSHVSARFNADAIAAHRCARGEAGRKAAGEATAAEICVDYTCDPPIDRVDAAAFVGRRLAEQLHQQLLAASSACTRLSVHAVTENGQTSSRTWRCAQPLTPEATADRIRWQLDGWLTGSDVRQRPDSPIVRLMLDPVELIDCEAMQYDLRGSGMPSGDNAMTTRARRALARVQGLLGGDAVRVPIASGGRGSVDRVTLIPLGDELAPDRDPAAPWPGQVLNPAPAVVLNAAVSVRDCVNQPVQVTDRGVFSAEPTTLVWGSRSWQLQWWAGPWSCDEQWWMSPTEYAGKYARAQVLLDDSRALLLRYSEYRWIVEGVYE